MSPLVIALSTCESSCDCCMILHGAFYFWLFVVYFYMLLCIILHSVMTCFRLFVCCLLLHVVVYNCNSAMIYFRLFVCCLLLYVVAVVLHV